MWTLKYNGIEKALKEWGFTRPQLQRVSFRADTLTLESAGRNVDAPAAIPYGATIEIFRTDETRVRWFLGRRIRNPRAGNPQGESQSLTFAGPWWYLEELIFQQLWYAVVNPESLGESKVGGYRSHLLLNSGFNGQKMTTAQQIAEVITYAASKGAPLQLAPGTPALDIPLSESVDVPCAEVITGQMRWAPDAVSWFDYATTPPTLHIARRAALAGVVLALPTADTPESDIVISDLQIEPREDLLRPSVHLKYEKPRTVDQSTIVDVIEDLAPAQATGTEFGALVATINLQGSTAAYAYCTIETAPIQPASLAWWQAKRPDLSSDRNLVGLPGGTPQQGPLPFERALAPELQLPYELVAGQIAPWLTQYTHRPDKVRAWVNRVRLDDGYSSQGGSYAEAEELTADLETTNAPSGTYSQLQSFDSGDPVPVGLAAQLYAALSVLHYEGRVTLTEQEVSGLVGVGQVLNLTGGDPAWQTMRALVQDVSEDWEAGQTHVTFGPPAHLGPADLVELLRVNRGRYIFTAPAARETGQLSNGRIELGNRFPRHDTSILPGLPREQFFGIRDTSPYEQPLPGQPNVGYHAPGLPPNALTCGVHIKGFSRENSFGVVGAQATVSCLMTRQQVNGHTVSYDSSLSHDGLRLTVPDYPGTAPSVSLHPSAAIVDGVGYAIALRRVTIGEQDYLLLCSSPLPA